MALIGHEGVELSVEHEDCNEAICSVCSGFNEEDPAATGLGTIRLAAGWAAARNVVLQVDLRLLASHSAQSIRDPPSPFLAATKNTFKKIEKSDPSAVWNNYLDWKRTHEIQQTWSAS
jgi:hypothetical protein